MRKFLIPAVSGVIVGCLAIAFVVMRFTQDTAVHFAEEVLQETLPRDPWEELKRTWTAFWHFYSLKE